MSAWSIPSCVRESQVLGDEKSIYSLDSWPQDVILRTLQTLAYNGVYVMAQFEKNGDESVWQVLVEFDSH